MMDEFDKMVEEMMKDLKKEDEVEDFELVKPDFEVWALGYNKDNQITDFEVLLLSSESPDQAIAWAKKAVEDTDTLTRLLKTNNVTIPEDVTCLSIEVEETVNVDGVATNAGSIFHETILLW